MIITVANFKGGVGKTTTAIHIAAVLATKDRTILVDGDKNLSSLEWAGSGFFNFHVSDLDGIRNEKSEYVHMVIDTEARPGDEDLNALVNLSDMLIVPTTPDALSIKASQKLINAIDLQSTDLRLLITMVPPPPSHDGADAYEFLSKKGLKVIKSQIRRFQAYKKASLAGCMVYQVKNPYSGIAWDDYKKAVEEILK